MSQPPWMAGAWRELGQREAAGRASNPRIRALYRDAGHPEIAHDEVAWCAAFVGACLARAGLPATGSLMARSYLAWGEALDEPKPGAIAVLARGSDPALGHVGFWIGETEDSIVLLGGNQGDAVAVAAFAKARVLGLRWPLATRQPAAGSGDAFERALAHVLEMEGGWSDDPHDPGGATNFGITLADYAAHIGVTLDAPGADRLRAELRAIAPETVRAIYRRRYWEASRAGALPAPLALMHFDAAVNHGVGGAVRMLQAALGVAVDGEIGPLTLAAAQRVGVEDALQRYAQARRKRYRRLPHFWRFGRGWLDRVERTLERASALARTAAAAVITKPTGESMIRNHDDTIEAAGDGPGEGKWWGHSVTIWGALLTALSTVLPALAPLLGLDLTPELVRQLGEHVVRVVQALGGLAGVLLTIWGRARATAPLERREVRMRV